MKNASETEDKTTAGKQFELGVEGLRGAAALTVLYTHLLTEGDLDPAYSCNNLWEIFEVSRGAVLLFFVLSGYVIGLTSTKPFSAAESWNYVNRRLIRIAPLYLLAILLSVWSRPVDSGWTILGNALFLQSLYPYGDLSIPPLAANSNLWSLNCEMLYYLLFIPVWATRSSWAPWFVAAMVLSLALWQLPIAWAQNSTCYMIGWAFWLGGFGLSRVAKPNLMPVRTPWLSLLLFWMLSWQLKPLWHIFHRLHWLPENYGTWIHFSYIDFLPNCLALILVSSGKSLWWQRILFLSSAVIPLGYLAFGVLRGNVPLTIGNHHIWYAVFGICLWSFQTDAVLVWKKLSYLGSISYGIYIFQRPVQWFVRDASGLPTGTAYAFILRLFIAVGLTLIVAHIAEKHLQPLIKRFAAKNDKIRVTL